MLIKISGKKVKINKQKIRLRPKKSEVNFLLADNKKIKKDLTLDKMIELRMAKKGDLVKILGRGKLDVPVNITAHKFSASAEKIIEKAGGKVNKI